jgi:hypothetical protein
MVWLNMLNIYHSNLKNQDRGWTASVKKVFNALKNLNCCSSSSSLFFFSSNIGDVLLVRVCIAILRKKPNLAKKSSFVCHVVFLFD